MSDKPEKSSDASHSMNGYLYQRYHTMKTILENMDNNTILEEGIEDIDITDKDKYITTNQIKYHDADSAESESLTATSGLLKVIHRTFDKQNIKKINYIVYNKNTTKTFIDKLYEYFDNKNYDILAKIVLIVCYNEKNKLTNEFKINNTIDNINKKFEQNKHNMKKDISKLYNFFTNKKEYDNYFSNFELHYGESYDELINKIHMKLFEQYPQIINNEQTKMYNTIKCNTLFYELYNILDKNMFWYSGKNNKESRTLKIEKIHNHLNKICESLLNPENIMKQYIQSITDTIDKNKQSITNIINYNTVYFTSKINLYNSIIINMEIINGLIKKYKNNNEYIEIIRSFKTNMQNNILNYVITNNIISFKICISYINNMLKKDTYKSVRSIVKKILENKLKIFGILQ